MAPIFVHAWWRAASTYLFAKLRAQPGLRCYYEPLHERVATLTLAEVRTAPNSQVYKVNRHPDLERGYFAEYEPLLAEGGTGSLPGLAYDRYLLAPREDDPDLEAYVSRLIASAVHAGKRPALCFVRSPMRALWMKRRFGGVHVTQIRDPRHQWASFLGARGNYFVNGASCIATNLAMRFPRAFAHLARLPDAPGAPALPRYARAARMGFVRLDETGTGPRRLYGMFFLLWVASALQSLSAADLVFDCDQLSADARARARAVQRFAAHGLALDLGDIDAPSHTPPPPGLPALNRIEALTLRQLGAGARPLVIAQPARVAARLRVLAPRTRALLEQALAALDSR